MTIAGFILILVALKILVGNVPTSGAQLNRPPWDDRKRRLANIAKARKPSMLKAFALRAWTAAVRLKRLRSVP